MININRFIAAAILGTLLVPAGIKPGVAQAQESAAHTSGTPNEIERKAESQAENRGATIEVFVNNDNEEKISKGLLGTGTQMPSPSPDPFSC